MESLVKAVRPTLEDAKRWTDDEWQIQPHGFSVEVPCKHTGCRMSKGISCATPTQLQFALRSAAQEKWYCHHHKLVTWENERKISSDLLQYLNAMKASPGSNKSKLHCKQRDLDFLRTIGLISVDAVPRGSKIGYEIELTEQGEQYLDAYAGDVSGILCAGAAWLGPSESRS